MNSLKAKQPLPPIHGEECAENRSKEKVVTNKILRNSMTPRRKVWVENLMLSLHISQVHYSSLAVQNADAHSPPPVWKKEKGKIKMIGKQSNTNRGIVKIYK